MIQQSPGSGNQNRGIPRQLQDLLHWINASVQHHRCGLTHACLPKSLKILIYLNAQLSRGGQNQCLSSFHSDSFSRDQVAHHWQDEGKGFPTSSLRQAQKVLLFEHVLCCFQLDRRRSYIAHPFQSFQYLFRQFELLEQFLIPCRVLHAWELLCFWFLRCLLFIGWLEASKQIYFWKVVVHHNKLMHDSSDSKNQSIKLQNIDEEPNEDKFLDNGENCSDEREQSIGKKRIHRKSDISNFIMKTYKILEEKRNAPMIEWTDGGDCFIVRNKEQFENQILPKFFKHRKFSSFVRQLNMYDFHKIRKEKEIPIFKHKFFKMGCFDLLHKIKRKSGDEMRDDEENPHSLNNQVVSTQNNIMSMPHVTHLNKTKSYNIFEQIELITQQNSELRSSINEISKKINHLQVSRSKRKEKLMKIMSSIIYFEMAGQATEEQTCFRDLQNNFLMDEDPLSLTEYTARVGNLYRIVRKNLIR